jgi:hypothetical protein
LERINKKVTSRKKNPSERSKAARLYNAFSGHTLTHEIDTDLVEFKVGFVVGVCDGLDFGEEKLRFINKPVLSVSSDGKTFALIFNDKLPIKAKSFLKRKISAILYTTVRDSETERYIHTFNTKSRPTLALSHDGQNLVSAGGAFTFTKLGFEDQK